MSKLATFSKGGVHPPDAKKITAGLAVEDLPLPDEVELILQQHFGSPATPVVKKKDRVAEGDIVGETQGLGANIHASVTGTIKEIGVSSHPVSVSAASITVERDPQSPPKEYPAKDWRGLAGEELLARVKKGGIVGMGGAGFPTHVKLAPPASAKIEVLIVNGVECEPYLTADHRLMVEYPKEIVEGAEIAMRILGIRQCYIGIEENKPDAIEIMGKAAGEVSGAAKIEVKPLEVKYPQGSEKQLIYSITGRRVPQGGLPFHVGAIVQNVGTIKSIRDAVALEKPLYERVITVSGKGIKRPANLKVRIGTKVSSIAEFLGGTTSELARVVMGGPLMGFAASTLDLPVTKTTSGVLFLTAAEMDESAHGQCIRCGWCVNVCPMGLSPNETAIYVEAGRAAETAQFGIFECHECGSCAFVCPAKRPLVQYTRLAKMKAKK